MRVPMNLPVVRAPLSDDEHYITPATKEKKTKRPLPHDESSQKDAKKHKQRPVDACLKGLTMVDGFPSGFHTGFFMLMHLHMVSLLLNTVMVVPILFRSELH